jgi:CRP/FNR family transcriptional regulator, anaerobic regulatory protein
MTLPTAKPNQPRIAPCAAMDCRACEFRSLTFCAGLHNQEIGELSSIVTRLRIEPQQIVFQEGDAVEHVFNVTSGVVKLYKLLLDGRRQITGFLLPGDFLGLASRTGYSYSAEAVTGVSLCRFPRHKLEETFDRFPRLQRRLFEIANDELVAAQDQMLLLGRKTALEKISSFLLRLSEREQRRGAVPGPVELPQVELPMTRGDIADYLGLTIETVSRTLSQLKNDSLITQNSLTEIELTNIGALQEITES